MGSFGVTTREKDGRLITCCATCGAAEGEVCGKPDECWDGGPDPTTMSPGANLLHRADKAAAALKRLAQAAAGALDSGDRVEAILGSFNGMDELREVRGWLMDVELILSQTGRDALVDLLAQTAEMLTEDEDGGSAGVSVRDEAREGGAGSEGDSDGEDR